jgi:hypothetical protein
MAVETNTREDLSRIDWKVKAQNVFLSLPADVASVIGERLNRLRRGQPLAEVAPYRPRGGNPGAVMVVNRRRCQYRQHFYPSDGPRYSARLVDIVVTHSTGDQWFDEGQFAAYTALGQIIGHEAVTANGAPDPGYRNPSRRRTSDTSSRRGVQHRVAAR